MSLVELVIELVSRRLHTIENIESPVDGAKLVCVIVGTDVAHSHVAAGAVFEAFDVWVFVLVVDSAG